ncbi:MAG: hypothetical protein JKX78_06680 [Alteromonadaceae bacterium]|nr:hypothetical protein [Alteromonadaceae bacterium]
MKKFTVFLLLAMLLFWGKIAYVYADQNKLTNIAIFYPQAKEPYRSIYQEIILGINNEATAAKLPINLIQHTLRKYFSVAKIIAQLEQQHIQKVIVLGRLGWKLAKKLPAKFNVVSGALPISPNGISGISLITDPAYLFKYLAQVAPQVKRIHVAYSKRNKWLIKLAKKAAKEQHLELDLKLVVSTKQAISFYQALFKSKVSAQDALWLPLDRISSHDRITLPLILEKAWSKEMVVFSSKPSHAKRGVLFSTYPDNFVLGKHLFTMVKDLDKQPQQKNFSALKSTLLAVNLRTAAHLGLKYSTKQQQQFKLTFPE